MPLVTIFKSLRPLLSQNGGAVDIQTNIVLTVFSSGRGINVVIRACRHLFGSFFLCAVVLNAEMALSASRVVSPEN